MLKLEGFTEQFQDYIVANTDFTPTLVVGTNFIIGNILDVQDLEQRLTSKILCTLFDEGGNLIGSGRRTRQERSFRFVFKGDYAAEAVNHGFRLLAWLQNHRVFRTSEFQAWWARADKLPSVIVRGKGGATLADFVVSLNVWFRTE
ncbi:MAG: hypothetical protein JSW58_08350 [Candidatus Latescibacterota bacterium]|nr:MAG: hypothetical protein JSW58_08350 [Candidatus Latescibacterota bacterium]